MASSKEYLEFILGQLSELEEITYQLNENLNSGFGPNVKVNSIQVEVTLAHILAFLIAIIISLYNVLAADCLPVQIGVNYEK